MIEGVNCTTEGAQRRKNLAIPVRMSGASLYKALTIRKAYDTFRQQQGILATWVCNCWMMYSSFTVELVTVLLLCIKALEYTTTATPERKAVFPAGCQLLCSCQ